MKNFVAEDSVVRKIWGRGDTILFIFAGAAAEFALNKAVDWLYFTGRLPADPLGRLFSTVTYARNIVFASEENALNAIDKISAIHAGVEANRQSRIPDWAYRDVLFMLIYYSIAAFELLERKLTEKEKEEVFDVFYRFGARMQLKELPHSYEEWRVARKQHLQEHMLYSGFTADLYKRYRQHLGRARFRLLLEGQLLVIPDEARKLLQMRGFSLARPLVLPYKFLRWARLDKLLRKMIMPAAYRGQIGELDQPPGR